MLPAKDGPMIYTVECGFADPGSEAAWNAFYSDDKLPALICVPGFRSSQRFRALHGACPPYLALHTVDGPHVLASDAYREKGGGSFARWQAHITRWHRNLYDGLDHGPEVASDMVLLASCSGPGSLADLGLAPCALRAVGLDRSPALRWLGTLPRRALPPFQGLPDDVQVYAPMTPCLTPPAREPGR